MLNVPELEERWKRYNRKRNMPRYIAGILVVLAAGGGAFLYFHPLQTEERPTAPASGAAVSSVSRTAAVSVSSPQSGTSSSASADVKPLRTAAADTVSTSASSTAAVQPVSRPKTAARPATTPAKPLPARKKTEAPRQKLTLQPSMDFIDELDTEEDEMDYYFGDSGNASSAPQARPSAPAATAESKPEPPRTLPAITTRTASAKPAAPTKEKKAAAPRKESKPVRAVRDTSKKMLIQRENDMKDIQDVIARFKKNKNPALSLFVARRYYAIGNYQQAYNYALITNEIDSSIEDSWLIFAKSLYKLDQKEMAIKTLKTYYEESGSVKAKITLDRMQSGEFE